MPDLLLSYFDTETPAIATGSVYALLFEPRTVKALDLVGGALENFDDAGDQEDFSILLEHHAVRSRYFSKTIDPEDIELPDTAPGDYYQVEYWQKAGASPNRSTDRLLCVEFITWLDGLRVDARLSQTQIEDDIFDHTIPAASATFGEILEKASRLPDEPAAARYESFCAMSYLPNVQRAGLCGWLEKDGQVQLGCTRAVFKLVDSSDVVKFEKVVEGEGIPSDDGQFNGQYLPIILNPNDTYFLKCTITDADDVEHVSAASPVTWN